MSDDYNREFIEAYVFLKCEDRNNMHYNDIINEAMELLKTRGYLYIDQVNAIIAKYYEPPKNIIDFDIMSNL